MSGRFFTRNPSSPKNVSLRFMDPTSSHSGLASVLCVDDTAEVAAALKVKLARVGGFRWCGWLASADGLVERAQRDCPSLVLLDMDMPGRDPFDALAELVERCPGSRVIIFTRHARRELIDRALDAGAWGYLSKNDGEEELVKALRLVAAGEFALGPEPRRLYDAT